MGLYSFMVKFVGLLNENLESLFVLPFRIHDRSLESQGVSDLSTVDISGKGKRLLCRGRKVPRDHA